MSDPATLLGADRVRSFADLGVHADLREALADADILTPFPIQELTLPLALAGADLIGQARTGTGKTLAFGIPLLQRVEPAAPHTQALVVVPTRELCLQVRGDLQQAGGRKGVQVVAVYGGKAIDPQSEAIAAGAPVVVGTPGRLLDLFRRGLLDLSTVTTLVLDEADEMLDLGFLPDVEQIVEATAAQRQTLLFSATMPSPVVALARRYLHKPTFLRADVEEPRIAAETEQYFLSCHRMDKPAVLARILQTPDRGLCLVFTRTKRMADVLADELRSRGLAAAPIHSDLRQDARERALERFRTGRVDVLVATEVAARGLDIEAVTHVVNYDCPDDEKMYLHRIGRTGRAGAAGVAVTLAVWNELARLEMIKKALDVDTPTHEVFSTSPLLEELFDLPPRDRRRAPAPDGSPTSPQQTGTADESGPAGGRPRRRRRGRGRGGGADDAGPASASPAAADVDTDSPAPASATPDAAVRRRVRRRGAADGGADAEAEAEQIATPAPVESERGPRPATRSRQADGPVQRVRVRPRAQRGRVPGDAGVEPAAAPPERGSPPPAAEAAERRPPRGSGRRRDRRGTGPSAPGGRPRAVPADVAGDVGRRRAAGARQRSSPPAGPASSPAEAVRGDGKPALHRPLRIAHLP